MSTDYSADHIALPTDTSIQSSFMASQAERALVSNRSTRRSTAKAAQVGDSLRIRDGLPLLTINGGGSLGGQLKVGAAKRAGGETSRS